MDSLSPGIFDVVSGLFCGFLAKNIGESIKGKQHVHEYVESILNDLHSDIVMYNFRNRFSYRITKIIEKEYHLQ